VSSPLPSQPGPCFPALSRQVHFRLGLRSLGFCWRMGEGIHGAGRQAVERDERTVRFSSVPGLFLLGHLPVLTSIVVQEAQDRAHRGPPKYSGIRIRFQTLASSKLHLLDAHAGQPTRYCARRS
jgi:hypothetical protein